MDQQEEKKKSFFDVLEEQNANPQVFAWSENPLLLKFSNDEYICDGTLITLSKESKPQKDHYILTLHFLFLCDDSASSEPPQKRKLKSALPLRNPRLEANTPTNGFRLTGYKRSYEYFCESPEDFEIWMEKLKRVCVCLQVTQTYIFSNLLGRGSFAKVHLCTSTKCNKQYAIKSIEKSKIMEHPRNAVSIQREIDILRRVDHPGIIKLFEVYESESYIHLVLEYLKGGELLAHLQSKGVYSEKDASMVIKCVLEALKYCHARNIIHRDLKPENLIIIDSAKDYNLKIADFGLATVLDPNMPETMRCGSPGYVAPEMLKREGYDTKADIFSAGVILYVILTGTSPFLDRTPQKVLARNKECNITFSEPCWKYVTPEGRDLVSKMLAKNPKDRITAKKALGHNWFTLEHTSNCLLSNACENMKKYWDESRFNVQKIKPEFSMITCSPLLSFARRPVTSRESSPLIFTYAKNKLSSKNLTIYPSNKPMNDNNFFAAPRERKLSMAVNRDKEMRQPKKMHSVKNTNVGFIPIPIPDTEDAAADFDEKDISEKETANSTSVVSALHKSFITSFDKRPLSSRNVLHQQKQQKDRRFTGPYQEDNTSPCFRQSAEYVRKKSMFSGYAAPCPFEETPAKSAPTAGKPAEEKLSEFNQEFKEEDYDDEVFVTAMCEEPDVFPCGYMESFGCSPKMGEERNLQLKKMMQNLNKVQINLHGVQHINAKEEVGMKSAPTVSQNKANL